jgi:hypothetical protein
MTALAWYQLALLLRSQRWLPPLLLFAVLVGAGSVSGEPLSDGLGWSALSLVPAVGWLTRTTLTAEPAAARACVAAASGPRRAHVAALAVALLGGLLLTLPATGFELLTSQRPGHGAFTVAAGGLAAAAVCAGVGSAIGALCSPPLVRRTAHGVLAMGIAVVTALAAGVSPASAAVRGTMSQAGHGFRLPLGAGRRRGGAGGRDVGAVHSGGRPPRRQLGVRPAAGTGPGASASHGWRLRP